MSAGQREERRSAWGVSLFLHIILLFLLIFRPTFFSAQRLVIEQGNDKEQEVIQATMVTEPKQDKQPPVAVAPRIVTPPKTQARVSLAPKPQPLVKKSQLLDALKKDINQKKLQGKNELIQHKVLNARALKQQLLAEKLRVEGLRAARMRGEVDRYRALILQVISQNWRLPGVPDKNRYAELLIHLAPGGTVLDVQVTKSSGNVGLDNSARAAVFRSSPLPVPADLSAFEPFRSFLLKVKPENIVSA